MNSGGTPVSVSDGHIDVYRTTDYGLNATLYSIPTGRTQQRIYVRGGEAHWLDIRLYRGNDPYADRQLHMVFTNVTVACDVVREIDIVLPSGAGLGSITGRVDMLGRFEWHVPGKTTLKYPDYSTVAANYGPFLNERWAGLGGDNTNLPSSGPFELKNMVPSTVDPASPGYAVSATLLFGTNRGSNISGRPAWGGAATRPCGSLRGATVSLSNVFEIDPGFLRGRIRLAGPPEVPGHRSLLRGIAHAGDDDLNQDGIPDVAGTYGGYWSIVGAEGLNRRAAGATMTAA